MNSEQRYLKIHFNDGTQMTFSSPPQVEKDFAAGKLKNVLSAPQLHIETTDRFYVFPWSSIKFIEGIPVPKFEIHTAIQNAELILSD